MKCFIWMLRGIFASGLLLGTLSACGADQFSTCVITTEKPSPAQEAAPAPADQPEDQPAPEDAPKPGASITAGEDGALTAAFPREADGDGLVCYILTGEWYNQPHFSGDGSFSQIWGAGPVDGTALEDWLNAYTGGAEPLKIPCLPLEEVSISALGFPKPEAAYPEPLVNQSAFNTRRKLL